MSSETERRIRRTIWHEYGSATTVGAVQFGLLLFAILTSRIPGLVAPVVAVMICRSVEFEYKLAKTRAEKVIGGS